MLVARHSLAGTKQVQIELLDDLVDGLGGTDAVAGIVHAR